MNPGLIGPLVSLHFFSDIHLHLPGIRQLQLMLLKVCLILGVEIHVNVEFTGLLEPQKEQPDEGKHARCYRC